MIQCLKTPPMTAPPLRELRSHCGNLLGILNDMGIEIKCRRCKRIETVSLKDLFQFYKDKEPSSSDPSSAINDEFMCHYNKEGKAS